MYAEDKNRKEKIQRTTFVMGIFSASIISFVLNVYANIYYEIVVKGVENFSNFNPPGIIAPTIVLVLVIGFLQFLIFDYKNDMNLDRSFFKRFFDYFDKVFWLTQLTKRINKVFWFIFKWLFIIIFAFSFYKISGWTGASIWIILILTWILVKSIYKRHYGKRKKRGRELA